MSILSFIDLSYSYNQKKTVFKGLNAELELGKIYAILGSSGCGKTTLLSLLGGLDSPTKGKIFFNGEDITEKGLAYHRRNHVSFIFQSYNLIDYLTPKENVELTSKLPPIPILEKMGLTKEEAKRNVLQLSGGQQQRVAIARALATEAPVILADTEVFEKCSLNHGKWRNIPKQNDDKFRNHKPCNLCKSNGKG